MTRRDGDTWDPATGVGMTATFRVAARAVASNKGLIDDPFAEPLVRAVGVEYVIQVVENLRYGHGGDDPVVTAFAADHMPTWTTSQLEAGRAFMEGWRRRQ